MKPINDRGAIMLIAAFFAIFGVAILYYMIGMGQAVLFRERMQDAADATALSAAIANARGMNFIVLINIVMAALLAILVTIKLVEGIAILGMFIAAALAWVTFGATLTAIPPLRTIQQAMNTAYKTTKDPVYAALEILNTTANVVKAITPLAADGIAPANISDHWGSSITNGYAAGSREINGLPVEDDTFDRLCGKAGTFPVELAEAALHCPAINPIFDKLKSAMNTITSDLSAWFCGDSSGGAPTYDQTENAGYPKLSSDDRCNESGSDTQTAHASDTTNPNCDKQQQDQKDAQPDLTTGSCQSGHDCSLGGPYDTRVVAAREQCDPAQSPTPVGYLYQYRTARVYYKWRNGQWQRLDPQYGTYVYKNSTAPPCGPATVNPTVAAGYNNVIRRSANVNDVLPVCSNEQVPAAPHFPKNNEISPPVDFTEVTQILGCTKSETTHVDFNLDGNGHVDTPVSKDADSNTKSPKRIEHDARRGDNSFQLRSLVIGTFPSEMADGIVKLSLWNQGQPGNPLSDLEPLGRISIAQAEYYYEGTESQEEWMWNMKWRARLRRFRLPDQRPLQWQKDPATGILLEAVNKLVNIEHLLVH